MNNGTVVSTKFQISKEMWNRIFWAIILRFIHCKVYNNVLLTVYWYVRHVDYYTHRLRILEWKYTEADSKTKRLSISKIRMFLILISHIYIDSNDVQINSFYAVSFFVNTKSLKTWCQNNETSNDICGTCFKNVKFILNYQMV